MILEHKRLVVLGLILIMAFASLPSVPAAADSFLAQVSFKVKDAEYFDLVNRALNLTPNELAMLRKNGFLEIERWSYHDFVHAYAWIYAKDLPVMITTDSMLEAIHQTFSDLLMRTESAILMPMFADLLTRTREQVRANKTSPSQAISTDVDIYLSVALALLKGQETSDNTQANPYIQRALSANTVEQITLFGGRPRSVDFTRFKPNGHYLKTPELGRYYRTVMWLSQIDFRLLDFNENGQPILNLEHIASAAVLRDAMNLSKTRVVWVEIEKLLTALFGNSDNTTLPNLDKFLSDAGINTPEDALNADRNKLVGLLISNDYGKQQISGQIQITANDNPLTLPTPVSFLLFGSRFTIDSYVLSQLVFDRLMVNGVKVKRAFPSPLDVMVALGNSHAASHLAGELKQYGYEATLDTLRKSVNARDAGFWSANMYNRWLDALRTLNVDTTVSQFPEAMRTAAWADKTLQTQLASWAHLRHDTELYVKQTYTSNVLCQYPAGYVEPYPAFYAALVGYAKAGHALYKSIPSSTPAAQKLQHTALAYFDHLLRVAEQLQSMAERELRGEKFAAEDEMFLKDTIVLQKVNGMCGLQAEQWDGWYAALYPWYAERNLADLNDYNPLVVTGIHTNTADQLPPQGVLHVGTGPTATQLFIVDANNTLAIYVSPAFTYYEFIEQGFPPPRLSDLEWAERLRSDKRPTPPQWTLSFRLPSAKFPDYQTPGR